MKTKLSKVVGLATFEGHNHRDPFEEIGSQVVTFRSELPPITEEEPPAAEAEEDGKKGRKKKDEKAEVKPPIVLYELIYGNTATDETKEQFVNLMRQETKLWALAQNMIKHGQLQPITLVHEREGQKIVFGHRRWISKALANILAPDIVDDEIDYIVGEGRENKLNEVAVSENAHRKDLSPVELGKTAQKMHKAGGMSYKEIAGTLGIYQKGPKDKPPVPNHQLVRNCALLWDPKVTDADREAILKDEKGYTRVLQQRGLIQGGTGSDDYEGTRKSKRKRSLSLTELKVVYEDADKLEKIAQQCYEKTGSKTSTEQVRFILSKAMQIKWKEMPEPEPVEA